MKERASYSRMLVIAGTLLAVAYLDGAQQSQPAPQGAPPTQPAQAQPFRATTLTVEVDVIVRDKSRKFVSGLQPSDFEILEDGTGQTMHSMYFVSGHTISADLMRPGATSGAPTSGAPPETLGREAGGPGGTSSTPTAAPRVFVLFFDQDHMDTNGFKRLQDSAEKFLTTDFQQGDVGGVLVGGSMAGNRLTADRDVLVKAVRGAKYSAEQASRKLDMLEYPRMSEPEAIRIELFNDRDVLQQVISRAEREGPASSGSGGRGAGGVSLENDVRLKARQIVSSTRPTAAQTVKTLIALVNGLARLPGRKTIIFLSDGFYVEESWAQLRNIVALAARSNIRFYAIDPQGLRRRATVTDPSQMNPMETGASIPTELYNNIEEGPNTLAVDTGGYVIRATNDFTGALSEIAADTGTYYVLGYTPANTNFDGKFRSITVRVKRPGVTVRARKGYLATPPSAFPATTSAAGPPVPPAGAPPAAVDAPPSGASKAAPAVGGAPTSGVAPPDVPAPGALPSDAITLRPDSAGRVRNLAAGASETAAAKELASRGWDRYTKGDLEGAEPLLEKAVAEPGAAPWVFYALGFTQVGLRKPQAALQSWEHVRATVPAFQPVYLDLADVYVQLNNPDRAIDILRSAEQKWPRDTDILNAIGTVQVGRGAHADAIETFSKAIAANPKDGLAYFNLARTCELRYYAIRRFSRPGARWVDDPELLTKARENYETYVRMGGPYLDQAQAALKRLDSIR